MTSSLRKRNLRPSPRWRLGDNLAVYYRDLGCLPDLFRLGRVECDFVDLAELMDMSVWSTSTAERLLKSRLAGCGQAAFEAIEIGVGGQQAELREARRNRRTSPLTRTLDQNLKPTST